MSSLFAAAEEYYISPDGGPQPHRPPHHEVSAQEHPAHVPRRSSLSKFNPMSLFKSRRKSSDKGSSQPAADLPDSEKNQAISAATAAMGQASNASASEGDQASSEDAESQAPPYEVASAGGLQATPPEKFKKADASRVFEGANQGPSCTSKIAKNAEPVTSPVGIDDELDIKVTSTSSENYLFIHKDKDAEADTKHEEAPPATAAPAVSPAAENDMATATGSSVSQGDLSNPFHENKGDLAQLLLERLDAWKHAVGYLEDYVDSTATLHKSLYKDYEKILKTVADPLREGHHFSQSNGGIATLFENIRVNTHALAENQVETEKALKGQVSQTLSRLHAEIKNKHKELTGGAFKGSKAVEKARGQTQKQIEHLGQHTASFSAAGGRIDPDNDPYIIRRGVLHHLNKQLLEENNHRKDLLEVQNNFLTFEKHVVETLQASMQIFFQIVGAGCCDKMKMLYSDMMTTAQNIPAEFEWSNFLTQHGETLVDPKSPDRTVSMIKFANQDHGSTKAMVEGPLQRKGKIVRSYNTAHYSITPAGYLHEFKESNDFKESPEPELSLYLPECAIGSAPVDGKFNISGKDANKNKNLTQKHEFRFKASSQAEATKWYEVASKFCTGTLTRQNSLLTSPTSPSDAAAANAIPPAYAEAQTASPEGGAKPAGAKAAPPAAAMTGAAPEKSAAPPATAAAPVPDTAAHGEKNPV